MPRENAYTLEEFGNRPLLEDVNPNMLMKDLYNPTQLYYLHLYDSATAVSYTHLRAHET